VLRAAIGSALQGTALSSPTGLATLGRAVAPHFVRNPQTRIVHNKAFAPTVEQSIRRWASTPYAAEFFGRRHKGLVPAGSERLRLGAEAAQERLARLFREGVLFRLTV
jgi:hypothetical protein